MLTDQDISHAAFLVGATGKITSWNAACQDMLGYAGHDVVAHQLSSIVAEPSRQVCQAGLKAARGTVEQLDLDLLHADGRSVPLNVLLVPQWRGTGKFSTYCVILAPASSQRQEQEVRWRLHERALHASSNGIVIARCGGTNNPIEYVNPAFERITGYTEQEVLGRDARFMAAPGMDKAQRVQLHRALNGRREINVVFRNLRKNGDLFWNDLTITPVLNEHGVASHFIGVLSDVTASIRRTNHLEHELNHDLLTGLASRTLLWDRLHQALHVAQRNKTLVATVLVDLDNFKLINDTLGHDGGDEVLRVVARRLQELVRDSDTVARLGGDEFVLVLDNQPSLRFISRMIDRLRQGMARPMMVNQKEIEVHTSMGVSIFPHDGASAIELIQAADVAMYHAKSAGRNAVHFFSEEMKATAEAKHLFELNLRKALEKEQIFLVFQPRICLKTGKIVSAQALLRWHHPEQGILLPAAFMPEAEENGLSIALGAWALDHICAILQRMKRLGYEHMGVSMQVSLRELTQKNYVESVRQKIAQFQLVPELLELEVKEANLMHNPQLTQEIFAQLRQLGIKLAIADFGEGASSLSILQDLAVDHLKIPTLFIDTISADGSRGVMAKTMIDIGHNMGIGVVADGVETSAQVNFLRQHGCQEVQGNYFRAPIAVSHFEQLLSDTAVLLPALD